MHWKTRVGWAEEERERHNRQGMHLGIFLRKTLVARTHLEYQNPYFCPPPFIEISHICEGERVLQDIFTDQARGTSSQRPTHTIFKVAGAIKAFGGFLRVGTVWFDHSGRR